MAVPNPFQVERPGWSDAVAGLVLVAAAAAVLAATSTPAAGQTPGDGDATEPSIGEIVVPDGARMVPVPGDPRLFPAVPGFPLPEAEGRRGDDRSSLDMKLRAGGTERRLPSARIYGTPFRPRGSPLVFGQTPGSWLSGGDRQLDGSSLGFVALDLLGPIPQALRSARDGPPPE